MYGWNNWKVLRCKGKEFECRGCVYLSTISYYFYFLKVFFITPSTVFIRAGVSWGYLKPVLFEVCGIGCDDDNRLHSESWWIFARDGVQWECSYLRINYGIWLTVKDVIVTDFCWAGVFGLFLQTKSTGFRNLFYLTFVLGCFYVQSDAFYSAWLVLEFLRNCFLEAQWII